MLRAIHEIPLKYRKIFANYNNFNLVQSQVFDDVFNTNKSIILSAPTGSGKTVIFELAIVHLLQVQQEEDFKIVYVAPIKALCNERLIDWSRKFHPYGIQCIEVTGDSDIQDFSDLISAKIIITTPEKWDSLTRKWKENENIVSSVKLFMIDEIHLLNEDGRGPILEAIVSRMKTIQFSMKIIGNMKRKMSLRFIGASATIPNIADLSEWIGERDMKNISFFQFSEEHRPVKLEKHILGYANGSSSFKFDIHLNYKLAEIIKKYSNGKPTLIFCSSRKSVEMASDVLHKHPCLFPLSDNQKTALAELSRNLQDKKLLGLITRGIAYHHAGLTYKDRNAIENGFRQGLILTLVSTNTLAMGVNLPAHLVIIKSTETFIRGTAIEYSESSILQMIGRAGRPQFDVRGVAVIMTQQKYVKKYENLMNGCTPVESHLHKHLAEHLNSEIVLQTITDIDVAMEWIRSTFLYIRAVKSPMNYGLTCGMSKEKVEKKLEEMCLIQINDLEANELITKDQTYGLSINATPYGRLMARYYISFETIKLFHKIRGNESYLEMFNKIIECKEFSEFTLRVNDKKILNDLNEKPTRFPVKGKIKTNANKVSCLIQANFGTIQIPDPAMMQDSIKMIRLGDRISKCCFEYIRLSEKRLDKNYGIFKALLNIIMITKCYRAKLWENSEYVCKQLNKIGNVYSSLLVNAGKTTLKSILDTEPRTLEMILGKQPPFGNDIHKSLLTFPEYELQLKMKGSSLAHIFIKQINQNYKFDGSNCKIIVGDADNRLLFLNDKVDFTIQEYGNFDKTFKIRNSKTHAIYAHLIHDSLVGVDKTITIILNPLEEHSNVIDKKPPTKKRIQTKLTDCPVPKKKSKILTTLKNSEKEIVSKLNQSEGYESLLDDDEIFNNISTQRALIENKLSESTIKLSQNRGKYQTNSSNIKKKQYENVPNSPIKRKLSNFEFNEKPKIMKHSEEEYPNMDDEFEYILQEAEREQEDFIDRQLRFGNRDSLLHKNDINEETNGKHSELIEVNNFSQNKNCSQFLPFNTIENSKTYALNSNCIQLETLQNNIAENLSKSNNFPKNIENFPIPFAQSSKSFENCSILDLSTKPKTENQNFTFCKTENFEIPQNEPIDFSSKKIKHHLNLINHSSSVQPLEPIATNKYEAPQINSKLNTKNVRQAIYNSENERKIKSFMDLKPSFAHQNNEDFNRRMQKRKFEVSEQLYGNTTCKIPKHNNYTRFDCSMAEKHLIESEVAVQNEIVPSSTLYNQLGIRKSIEKTITSNCKIDSNNFHNTTDYNTEISKLNSLPKNLQNFGISHMNLSANFAASKISEVLKLNNEPTVKINKNCLLTKETINFSKWEQIFSNTSKKENGSQYLLNNQDYSKDLNYNAPLKTINLENKLPYDSGIFTTNNLPEKSFPTTKSRNLGMTNFSNKLSKPITNIARPENIFHSEVKTEKHTLKNTEFVKASKILDKNNWDEGLVIPQNNIYEKFKKIIDQNINNFNEIEKVNTDSVPFDKLQENCGDFIAGINKTPEHFTQSIHNESHVLTNKKSETVANLNDNFPKEFDDTTIKRGIFPTFTQPQYPIAQKTTSNNEIKLILKIICIGNISVHFDNGTDILQIPNYHPEECKQIQNPQMGLFFEENPNKINFKNSSKLVRLEDINENVIPSSINVPIINFSLPKPNLFEEIIQGTNKLFNIENKSNPYRLRIPRREKIIPVENRAYLDEQEQKRKIALSNLQIKLKKDPNYDENTYMNDYISCLMSKEVTNLFDDFDFNDENEMISNTFFEPENELSFHESQDIPLGLSVEKDACESMEMEKKSNEMILEGSKESNFILNFSQNMKENCNFEQNFWNY